MSSNTTDEDGKRHARATPGTKPGAKPGAAPDRQTRLADALRANLHRRKAQARARDEAETPESSQDNEA